MKDAFHNRKHNIKYEIETSAFFIFTPHFSFIIIIIQITGFDISCNLSPSGKNEKKKKAPTFLSAELIQRVVKVNKK